MNVIFSNGQRIIKQIFDWLQTSSQTKTANFITDSFQTGIVPLELGEFSVAPGSNNTSITPSISIGSGVAYGPDSSRIIIASGDVTPYNSLAPATQTNDGTGTLVLTPQSTGCINVPLTQSAQNYVWIQYLATIDTSAFTISKESPFPKEFYKSTDGYQITVIPNNPASPGPNYLFLARVNMLAGGAVTPSVIFVTNRTYFQISENVVPITTAFNDRSNATSVYSENSVLKLEDHIKSIGTGTGQSSFNPHNMSLQDLGVSAADTTTAHRQLEHGVNGSGPGSSTDVNNAIIAGIPGATPYPNSPSYPNTSAMKCDIIISTSDYILVHQLLSTEFAIVNGSAFNVTSIFGAVPADASVTFPNISTTYHVFWDSVTKTFNTTTSLTLVSTDPTKLWLCTVDYAYVGILGHNTLSNLIERRRIGSTTERYQRWVTTARPPNPIPGEYGFNVDINAPEWFDGTSWNSLSVPTGTMLDFAGVTIPAGYYDCDGSVKSQITDANLFVAIGINWNTGGEGAGNFRLPDFRRRTAVGSGGAGTAELGNTVGNTGGEEVHTLINSEVPVLSDPTHEHSVSTIGITGARTAIGFLDVHSQGVAATNGIPADGYANVTNDQSTGRQIVNNASTGISYGGGSSHNTMQPSAIVTKIIKY